MNAAMRQAYDELLFCYVKDRRNRRYHDVNHILMMQRIFDSQHGAMQLGIPTVTFPEGQRTFAEWFGPTFRHLLDFAIVGHDVIYDTNLQNNEELSAITTRNVMVESRQFSAEDIEYVFRAIMATRTHQEVIGLNEIDDRITHTLICLDLAFLAMNPADFAANTDDIRFEYRQYNDEQWAAGRKKFFQTMLAFCDDGFPLYPLPFVEKAWGERARENLRNGLAALG